MFLLVTHSCLSLESENLVCFIPISIYVQKKYVMGYIYIYYVVLHIYFRKYTQHSNYIYFIKKIAIRILIISINEIIYTLKLYMFYIQDSRYDIG